MASVPIALLSPTSSIALANHSKLSPEQRLLDVGPDGSLVVSNGQHVSCTQHPLAPAHAALQPVPSRTNTVVHRLLHSPWRNGSGQSLLAVVYAEAVEVHALRLQGTDQTIVSNKGSAAAPRGMRIRTCAWHPQHPLLAVASQSGIFIVSCTPGGKLDEPDRDVATWVTSGACSIVSAVSRESACRSPQVFAAWVSTRLCSGLDTAGTLLVSWGSEGAELISWKWNLQDGTLVNLSSASRQRIALGLGGPCRAMLAAPAAQLPGAVFATLDAPLSLWGTPALQPAADANAATSGKEVQGAAEVQHQMPQVQEQGQGLELLTSLSLQHAAPAGLIQIVDHAEASTHKPVQDPLDLRGVLGGIGSSSNTITALEVGRGAGPGVLSSLLADISTATGEDGGDEGHARGSKGTADQASALVLLRSKKPTQAVVPQAAVSAGATAVNQAGAGQATALMPHAASASTALLVLMWPCQDGADTATHQQHHKLQLLCSRPDQLAVVGDARVTDSAGTVLVAVSSSAASALVHLIRASQQHGLAHVALVGLCMSPAPAPAPAPPPQDLHNLQAATTGVRLRGLGLAWHPGSNQLVVWALTGSPQAGSSSSSNNTSSRHGGGASAGCTALPAGLGGVMQGVLLPLQSGGAAGGPRGLLTSSGPTFTSLSAVGPTAATLPGAVGLYGIAAAAFSVPSAMLGEGSSSCSQAVHARVGPVQTTGSNVLDSLGHMFADLRAHLDARLDSIEALVRSNTERLARLEAAVNSSGRQ